MSAVIGGGHGGSPFVSPSGSVAAVMRRVLFALLPGIALYIWYFGWGVAVNLTLAGISAVCFEAIMLRIRRQPVVPFVSDGSALVTAVLLGLSLPPMVPWWLVVLGSFIAIVVAKQLYGGLGYNPFNPAMAAYAVLLISFPRELSLWVAPSAVHGHDLSLVDTVVFSFSGALPGGIGFDAITAATPLDKLRTDTALGESVTQIAEQAVFGRFAGRGMEWVNLAFLAGGLWLIACRLISWHIPAAVLGTLAVMAWLGYLFDPGHNPGPLLHLLAGATALGAFFIATDPVTAATTPLGKLIYGAGIGMLTYVIRTWGGYPDGMAFAVLLMGLTVPLLDQYTSPSVFGSHRGIDGE